MLFKFTLISITSAALLLSGCQSSPKYGADRPDAKKIIQHARAQIGSPYRYGGESPKAGFDCSGLVYYSHKKVGLNVPRTTGGQYRSTAPIARKHLQPGDLVFFSLRHNRKISHVGIYLGANRFVHAPSKNKHVSIADMSSPFWNKRFVRGGRFRL